MRINVTLFGEEKEILECLLFIMNYHYVILINIISPEYYE